MAASYRYNNIQKQAVENAQTSSRRLVVILMLAVALALLVLAGVYMSHRHKQAQQAQQKVIDRQKADYAKLTDQYEKTCQALLSLEKAGKADGRDEAQIAMLEEERNSLAAALEKLKSQKAISAIIDQSKAYFNTEIVKKVIEAGNNPRLRLLKRDFKELLTTTADYYPELVSDVSHVPGVTAQEVSATLLVALGCHTDDIARLLEVSRQRITNIKADQNSAMFGVKSAKLFFENLKSRYGIYPQE